MKKMKLQIPFILMCESLFTKMVECKGHKLDFELNKNLYALRKADKTFQEEKQQLIDAFMKKGKPAVLDSEGNFLRLKKAKEKLGEGEQDGVKFDQKTSQELQEAQKKILEQEFEVEIIPLPKNKVEKAIKDGKFEGIDMAMIFDVLEKLN